MQCVGPSDPFSLTLVLWTPRNSSHSPYLAVYNYEGLEIATLKHLSHHTFHKTSVIPEDEARCVTCFYRWHIDAALYELSLPKVTMLYAVAVLQGP